MLHLIPYDTVGGVETAARSVPGEWEGTAGLVSLRRAYLVTHSPVEVFAGDWHGPTKSVNHPVAHWTLLRFTLRSRPDLLIASLWRSCPALIALKLLRPRTKVVLFLHSAVDVHVLDRLLNRAAMRLADEIWANSETTLQSRVPRSVRKRAKVLSFLTQRPKALPRVMTTAGDEPIPPSFVYWGRLQSEKNLGLALDVFASIRELAPRATFDIIGPDRGSLAELQARVANLDLGKSVRFVGALPQRELLERASLYRFYLQTSLFEGTAMSVIEAMATGLVPVVTPVGEIPSYCKDGENSIHVTTPKETAERVAAVCADPAMWTAFSLRAAERWAKAALFRDDYCAACDTLLTKAPTERTATCAE